MLGIKRINDQREKRYWQFWIDVGGTFTDCLALDPDGQTHHNKVLSSGLVKGRFGPNSARQNRVRIEPGYGPNFWVDATLRLLDARGQESSRSRVSRYDTETGDLEFQTLLPKELAKDGRSTPALETATGSLAYELDHSVPAPILAIRKILQCGPSVAIPQCSVHLGTTRGTNALLTRSGAATALVTTKGFKDLLRIGDQARPHLFELAIRKSPELFETAIEIDERILADGTIERQPTVDRVRAQLSDLKKNGIESVAICLMHGFRFPQHEQMVGQIACEFGFQDVRLSSSVAPLIKFLSRGETTVLDAYLNPVLGNYLAEIQQQLSPGSQLQLMTSAGGLVDPDRFSGKDAVLSGPAGGIVGAARVAEQAGFQRVISFDMGGTSSDVGRYDGAIELEFETRKSDVRIMTPIVSIETVAAGGGSVCAFDGSKLVVGPQSATSDPGPACYGRGGPLTVTDVNLFLGRIVNDRFPFPLDESAVTARIQEICRTMSEAGFPMTPHELAIGFLAIANQNMASAIRSVSVARGYDPQEHVLVAFGGAGPQHCCAVAEAIGIERILDHHQGSILSAVGIRLADQTANHARSLMRKLDAQTLKQAQRMWEEMEAEVREQLGNSNLDIRRALDLRYEGTEASQTIQQDPDRDFETSFSDLHHQLFGFNSDRPLECVAVRIEGRLIGNRLSQTPRAEVKRKRVGNRQRQMWQPSPNGPLSCSTDFFDRDELAPGDQIDGPAIIAGELSTTIVDPGWQACVMADGQILLEHRVAKEDKYAIPRKDRVDAAAGPDPVRLEIFNNHFSAIARQMGISLQRTSISVNVKERLDFSCAVFTGTGDLVVNAPHIPVHLGAMSETVRAIIRLNRDDRSVSTVNAGDVFVTNDPFAGGSHLPDVTVVTPVHDTDNGKLVFWVASRSHHSEIGGISPGSMPSGATNLAEEGVLIRNFKIIEGKNGKERFGQLQDLLTALPYPSRSPHENLADIRAQIAANRSGQRDLLSLVQQYSAKTVLAYMAHIQTAAEEKVRAAIQRMNNGTYAFQDSMDNGAIICVTVEILDDQLKIDFAGTSPVQKGNLNANPAIVASAVIYVMRCLIDEDIPLNEGVMNPVTILLPECFLNPASFEDPALCPAVVGGNVETSQRIVDVILGALNDSVPMQGLAAASQGTMNNWLMGDASFGYYETLGGGAGATYRHEGADAVHTHMTNTRLTDPEILETRYPVILRELAIRQHSGGSGSNRGGNGMLREVEFRQPMTVSLLTSRRTKRPYGILGGKPGAAGKNVLLRDHSDHILPGSCEIEVQTGDRLRIETPGGGGWGAD